MFFTSENWIIIKNWFRNANQYLTRTSWFWAEKPNASKTSHKTTQRSYRTMKLRFCKHCTEKTIFPFPFSEWDMIAVAVFEPNGNAIWFKNCHRDHISFTVKGGGNIVFSAYIGLSMGGGGGRGERRRDHFCMQLFLKYIFETW